MSRRLAIPRPCRSRSARASRPAPRDRGRAPTPLRVAIGDDAGVDRAIRDERGGRHGCRPFTQPRGTFCRGGSFTGYSRDPPAPMLARATPNRRCRRQPQARFAQDSRHGPLGYTRYGPSNMACGVLCHWTFASLPTQISHFLRIVKSLRLPYILYMTSPVFSRRAVLV